MVQIPRALVRVMNLPGLILGLSFCPFLSEDSTLFSGITCSITIFQALPARPLALGLSPLVTHAALVRVSRKAFGGSSP